MAVIRDIMPAFELYQPASVDEALALPSKEQVYQTTEGTITHFELVMANRGLQVPHDECYAATEAPNGERDPREKTIVLRRQFDGSSGICRPVVAWSMSSGIEPRRFAMTGVPHAMASTTL